MASKVINYVIPADLLSFIVDTMMVTIVTIYNHIGSDNDASYDGLPFTRQDSIAQCISHISLTPKKKHASFCLFFCWCLRRYSCLWRLRWMKSTMAEYLYRSIVYDSLKLCLLVPIFLLIVDYSLDGAKIKMVPLISAL